MATDTAALAPESLAPETPAAPADPTRHLWQVPVLLLGIGVFVAEWRGWWGTGKDAPGFGHDVAALKAEYEKLTPDPAVLKTALDRVARNVEEHAGDKQQGPAARFHLGSGYARLAELTPVPDEARGYWQLAHQHFELVTDPKLLGDPAAPPKLAFRAAKARAAILPTDTPPAEIALLMNVLSLALPGEDSGETQRLIAELALRQTPPDTARAKVALALYVQGTGIATPAASLARGRLRLGILYVQTGDYPAALKVLSDIGGDAPPDVFAPAKAALARVHMADGNWAEATKALDALRAAPGVPPAARTRAAYQLGVCKQVQPRAEPEAAAKLFEEAAKGDGPEASAAAIRLADLHLRSADPARHKTAVELLIDAIKNVRDPASYDQSLVPLNEVQAVFELAVTVLLADGAYETAERAARMYEAVAAPGRDREKRAEVYGAWGFALKKTPGGDPKPKFRAAADEFAALVAYQPKTDGKVDVLRRAAALYREAGDPNGAAKRLEEAAKLPDVPEQLLPVVWVELVDALLSAGRVKEVWPIFNRIMTGDNRALSTATRYRLARQFVDSRHPDLVPLGRALFEQIAKKTDVAQAEREFHERSLTELANALIREGNFADAEVRLRSQLELYKKGQEAGLAKLLLGVCLLQRAAPLAAPTATPGQQAEATKMRTEAAGLFKKIVTDCDDAEKANNKLTEREAWLRVQAALRVLQTYQQLKEPRKLLFEAYPMLDRYRGTVEELIILSLVYHAFKQSNDTKQALDTRDRMKDAFDKLPPSAFPAKDGEYSRDYWLRVWFAPEKK